MNILSATTIKDWDAYTIANEPISSLQLMERASKKAFEQIIYQFPEQKNFVVFCGAGNNGGDGLVIARLLHQCGKQVRVYLVTDKNKTSAENSSNQQLLPISLYHINDNNHFPVLLHNDVIIDALFGIGINRPVEGVFAHCIDQINRSNCRIVSIDCPSGLLTDVLEQPENVLIVKATLTITFQVPKIAFMVGKGLLCCGKLVIIDIGLHPGFSTSFAGRHASIAGINKKLLLDEKYIQLEDIQKLYLPRNVNAEKRDFGSALLIGGSYGMIGSIALAAKAALSCGAGLATILAPNCGYQILQTSLPEAMILETLDEKNLCQLPDITRFTTLAIGTGLGKNKATNSFIDALLELKRPMVLDADALNLIADNNWQLRIPQGSVITPHSREFSRLFGKCDTESKLLNSQKNNAHELGIYIVLKGAHTRVVFPNNQIYYNSTGNSGMAKGGSGDVLTGIITGLWARFNDLEKAILMGIYLHGLAGDFATSKFHQESILATDIIACLPDSFKQIYPYAL